MARPTSMRPTRRPPGARAGGAAVRGRAATLALGVGAVLAALASVVTWLVWDRFVLPAAGAVVLGWAAGWLLSSSGEPADDEPWAPEPEG